MTSPRASLESEADQAHDREILQEEEERENLIAPKSASRSFFSGPRDPNAPKPTRVTRKDERAQNRKERRAKRARGRDGGDGVLLYDLGERGYRDDSSSVSSVDRVPAQVPVRKVSSRRRCLHIILIPGAILALLLLLVFGAIRMSGKKGARLPPTPKALVSNGTSNFAPTTLLISLDGFRTDFLDDGVTPTLEDFLRKSVHPKYMLPSFPTVTFPNHFTLVTGLYPESHGVVGNQFWDPDLQEEFYYTDPSRSMQPKWWLAEPLWSTAEKQNVRSAVHMWPGSEAHIQLEPTFVDKYNSTEALSRKVDRVLGLLDLPTEHDPGVTAIPEGRPQFIAMYVPNVDHDAHLYGPSSDEIKVTLKNVDTMIADLLHGIETRNLTDIVNVVIVSDHGMAATKTNRLIQLDDLIDPNLIEHIDGWPLYGLRLKDPSKLQSVYEDLFAKAANNRYIEVYLRETMPERYHFSKSDRIAPLWIVPQAGWAIVEKKDFDIDDAKKTGKVYHPLGLHGYDNEHPLMRALFAARGPAFPHANNRQVPVFQNIEVYNLVCESLGIIPNPNNGTLHLPLEDVGTSMEMAQENNPVSPPTHPSAPIPPSAPSLPTPPALPSPAVSPSTPVDHTSSLTTTSGTTSATIGVTDPGSTPLDPTTGGSKPSDNKDGKKGAKNWIQELLAELHAWAVEAYAKLRGSKNGTKHES